MLFENLWELPLALGLIMAFWMFLEARRIV